MTFAQFWNGSPRALFWLRNPYGAEAKQAAMDAVAQVTGAVVIGDVRPDSAEVEGGTPVIIHGSNFTGATGVVIGGNAATSFIVRNDGEIHCTAPAHAAGAVDVVVDSPLGNVTLPASLTYL